MADNINLFKNHLDKFWSSCEFVYSYSIVYSETMLRHAEHDTASRHMSIQPFGTGSVK